MNGSITKSRSLRTRITLYVIVIFLACIWFLAFFTSWFLRRDIEHLLGQEQLSTVSVVASHINTEIEVRIKALESVAERISPELLANPTALQEFLENNTALAAHFNSGLWVTGKDGVGIADLPKTMGRTGVSYAERVFMKGALAGKTTIGEPVMGKRLKAPAFAIASPIRDQNGAPIGALLGAINLGLPNFLDRITDNKYGETGGYVIFAPDHRVIVTATDKTKVMKNIPKGEVPAKVEPFLGGVEGSAIINAPDDDYLASFKTIPSANWVIAARLPLTEAFTPITAMERRVALTVLVLTVLSGLVTWWVLRRALKPMSDAANALAVMNGSHEPFKPLPVSRRDEIGELVLGFNQLIETVRSRDENLRESEEKYRSFFNTVRDCVFIADMEGKFTEFNESMLHLFGISGIEDYKGKTFASFCEREEDASRLLGMVWENGYVQDFPITMITAAGTKIETLATVSVMQGKNAQPGTLIGSIRDITERNLMAAQLAQAQKMESVGRLAGGVAHDFNNMLSVIMGHAEMLIEKTDPGSPRYSDLEAIRNAAERSANLTRQLLAFARKQSVMPKAVDLNNTIEGILKMLRRLIGENIQLSWIPEPGLWPIHIDPSQIDQILANLCVNSRDAISGMGKITIVTGNLILDSNSVETKKVPPGDYVTISFTDTGCGMDEETLQNLFEPFYTTKGLGKGTGLGLATVYGIIEQNRGTIEVVSEPGKGTIFTIFFPRYTGECITSSIAGSDSALPRGTETVLLVEDEPLTRDITHKMLTSLGYKVIDANSPHEAVSMAEKNGGEPWLLLTDVIMPEMNGKELSEKLPGFKTIFMSGYTADVIAQHGVIAADINFIPKPFTIKQLSHMLRKVLDA